CPVGAKRAADSRFRAFFFHRRSSGSGLTHSPAQHLAAQKLGSATGHGVHIQAEELGHTLFAAMTRLQALQPGVEPALLLVEQTIKQRLGRLHILTLTLLRLPCGPLFLPSRSVQRAIKITAFPVSAI